MARRRGGRDSIVDPEDRAARTSGHERSQRQLRVGEGIRRALIEVLAREEVREPLLLAANLTVTEVQPSRDLKHATCYVSPLGGGDAGAVLKALKLAAPWLSGQVARRIQLKYACRLAFSLDERFDNAQHIDSLLRRPDVAADLRRAAEAAGGDDGSGDGA